MELSSLAYLNELKFELNVSLLSNVSHANHFTVHMFALTQYVCSDLAILPTSEQLTVDAYEVFAVQLKDRLQ